MSLKALVPRVGVASVSSPLEVGADRAPHAARELASRLEQAGCEVVELGPIDNPETSVAAGLTISARSVHAVAVAAASWFEDYLVLDLLEECSRPVLLWSLPGMETGALCGCQQLTAYLRQLGVPYRGVFGPLDGPDGLASALQFLRAAALKVKLRRARVGLAGHRVTGMTEVSPSEMALKKTIGPRIVPLDVPQLLERASSIPDEQVRATWHDVTARSGCCKVAESDGLDSMKVHAAVRELVVRHGLDALTIGCYPHLMGRVCLAASLLADEGIPLGCEGDVNGAVGQLILTWLTGGPTHNTDWLEPLEDGSVVFTHCGSGSLDLAESRAAITLGPVRLMDRGVCALFPARPGPVTLLSMLPNAGGYQVAILEGEAVPTTMVFPGNPLRVRFPAATPRIIEWIFENGIGHHWMAGYGHVGAILCQWAGLCGPGLDMVAAP